MHRISTGISALLVALLFFGGHADAQEALTAERVRELAEHAVEAFAPKGLELAVIQDGRVLVELAYGESKAGSPMKTTTLLDIASCTKAFTAASVAMLVEEGKVGWDDPVIEHVPEFGLSDSWITAHMTVRDLLCHRCGLTTFEGDLLWYGTDYDDAEVMRRMKRLPIEQRFRDQFGYQNLMYLVAGVLIERESGMTWSEFVQRRLLTPLGMTASRPDAGSLPPDADRAVPHIDGEPIADHEFVACKPAAAIRSSAHELTSWMRMLLAGGEWNGRRLLSESSLRMMWRPHTSLATAGSGATTQDFQSYGLGWFLSVEQGSKLVEHDGGMPGFLSKVSLIPSDGFGFVVLNNANDGVLNEAIKRALLAERAGGDGIEQIERLAIVGKRIERLHRRQEAARVAMRRLGTKPSHELPLYAGRYEDRIYGPARVSLGDDGELSLVLLPSKSRLHGTMHHWHDDTFRVDFPDRFLPFALVRFELDANSQITGMRIDCPIADFDFGALDFRRVK